MSTYSTLLQPALQNLLQRVVRFFHPRFSCYHDCQVHISADVCGGRKSLVKPVTQQNISSCSVLSPEIVMYDDAYIGGRSENNIKCVMHDDVGWKNRTTRYILLRHWLYEWFSQFHRCGTYSVLSLSPSIAVQRSWWCVLFCVYRHMQVVRRCQCQLVSEYRRQHRQRPRNCHCLGVITSHLGRQFTGPTPVLAYGWSQLHPAHLSFRSDKMLVMCSACNVGILHTHHVHTLCFV